MAEAGGGLSGADRRDVDDRPASRLGEQTAEDAEHEEGAAHVDPQGRIDDVDRHLLEGAAAGDDARVVDQDVESAVGDDLLGRGAHGGLVADIEREGRRADLSSDGGRGIRVHIADEDLVSGVAEGGGDAAAEPGCASGDQDPAGRCGHVRPH